MSRWINADELIADIQERYCKPCKERKEDHNGVWCRACWIDDAMDIVDGFGDIGIDLVRCAECHWARPRTLKGETGYRCVFYRVDKAENGYCDIGERRE